MPPSLIGSPTRYLMRSKNHEVPNYVIFSLLLLLYPTWAEIFPLVLSNCHRSRWPPSGLRRGLRPLASWDWGFESRPETRLSVSRECCVLSGSLIAERQQWGRLVPLGMSSHDKKKFYSQTTLTSLLPVKWETNFHTQTKLRRKL